MPIAPGRRPITAGKDAVLIPSHQRPAGRRRDGAARVGDFVLELSVPDDPRDSGITGESAHRLGRDRPAPLQLTGRRALEPGERVSGGLDDQLRPRPGAVRAVTLGLPRATRVTVS